MDKNEKIGKTLNTEVVAELENSKNEVLRRIAEKLKCQAEEATGLNAASHSSHSSGMAGRTHSSSTSGSRSSSSHSSHSSGMAGRTHSSSTSH